MKELLTLSKPHICKYLKYSCIITIVGFCLINIYRSTTQNSFTSSHEFFLRQHSHDELNDLSLRNASLWWHLVDPDGKKVENYAAGLSQVRFANASDYPEYNVSVGGESVRVPLWQRKLRVDLQAKNRSVEDHIGEDERGSYYFLTSLLQVRIYAEDKAQWTIKELKQWIHFMFLAGVEHVYVCDHHMHDSEKLDGPLRRYLELGLVSYLSRGRVRHPMTAQIQCYQHLIDRYHTRHVWQIAIDMDEYPFSLRDTEEQFLSRYLLQIQPTITEVSLPNFLMLGSGDRSSKTVIQRIIRMTKKPANDLVKPVYRPDRVRANVHHNHILSGDRLDANPNEIRMLHYWGRRAQEWKERDTPKVLSETKPMTGMKNVWGKRLEESLIAFGELNAFSNTTGP